MRNPLFILKGFSYIMQDRSRIDHFPVIPQIPLQIRDISDPRHIQQMRHLMAAENPVLFNFFNLIVILSVSLML